MVVGADANDAVTRCIVIARVRLVRRRIAWSRPGIHCRRPAEHSAAEASSRAPVEVMYTGTEKLRVEVSDLSTEDDLS